MIAKKFINFLIVPTHKAKKTKKKRQKLPNERTRERRTINNFQIVFK